MPPVKIKIEYKIIKTSLCSTLEKMINELATNGWVAINIATNSEDEYMALLVKELPG